MCKIWKLCEFVLSNNEIIQGQCVFHAILMVMITTINAMVVSNKQESCKRSATNKRAVFEIAI